jgi:hypothetical protein
MTEICSKYGSVRSIKIPRPIWLTDEERQEKVERNEKEKADNGQKEEEAKVPIKRAKRARDKKEKPLEPIDDITFFDFPKGFGSIYVQFEDKDNAMNARRNIDHLKYDGRTVECRFYPEKLFEEEKFGE